MICVRYHTTPWDVEANATTETLRHVAILNIQAEDAPVPEVDEAEAMEAMLANISTVAREPVG